MELIVYDNKLFLLQKDEQFMKIQNLIEAKRNLLLKKQKKINKIQKQNEFLGEIRDDYNNYYSYVRQQKEDQVKALSLLDNYISNLIETKEISMSNIEDAKQEQKKILHEINSIRKGLNEIISNVNEITVPFK